MDCEFIISDETLISPTRLLDLEGVQEPLYKTGQVRWYKKPQKGRIYVVALDPIKIYTRLAPQNHHHQFFESF